MTTICKSSKLANVLYDVRGPIVEAAQQMEEEGQKIIMKVEFRQFSRSKNFPWLNPPCCTRL